MARSCYDWVTEAAGLRLGAAMKPLLIIPPAPARWPALEDLLRHRGLPWLPDIAQRFGPGILGAQDALAVLPAAGQFLASACINKCGDVGVLGHCYTRPEHRLHGFARRLVETVVSWFDMTGGKWLFLGTTAELDEPFYRKFGFAPLHRVAWKPYDHVMTLRIGRGVTDDPLTGVGGDVAVRTISRAEWPAMVALLQYRRGADPRVTLHESAVTAEVFTLDLIEHQERGACRLLGAFQGPRLVGIATVATDRVGDRTYAMLLPHTDPPLALRAAVEAFAESRGYAHVDYPMEALRSAAPRAVEAPSIPAPQTPAPALATPQDPHA